MVSFVCLVLVFFIFLIVCGLDERVFVVDVKKVLMICILFVMECCRDVNSVLNNCCMRLLIVDLIGEVEILM